MSNSTPAIQGIDHLIIKVQDLDRSNSLWKMLGFLTSPRGFHNTGGTANHLIMLDDTYIELLGVANRKQAASNAPLAGEALGLQGIALRGSAQSTFRFWNSLGLEVAGPVSLSRGVDIACRSELARFQLTLLAPSRELPFLTFCCEHLTPQFVWHSETPRHPNGAHTLREVVLIVADEHAIHRFERITGRPAVVNSTGSGTIQLGGCRIVFLAEANFVRRFGAATVFKTRARPVIAAIVIATADPERARTQVQRVCVPIQPAPTGGFFTTLAEEGVVVEWQRDTEPT